MRLSGNRSVPQGSSRSPGPRLTPSRSGLLPGRNDERRPGPQRRRPTSVLSRAAVSATARHPPIARMCDFVRSRCPSRAHRAELAGRADAVRAQTSTRLASREPRRIPGSWPSGECPTRRRPAGDHPARPTPRQRVDPAPGGRCTRRGRRWPWSGRDKHARGGTTRALRQGLWPEGRRPGVTSIPGARARRPRQRGRAGGLRSGPCAGPPGGRSRC
jgi:hypothetical protein